MRSFSTAMKTLLSMLMLLVLSCPSSAQQDDPGLRERFLEGIAQTGQKLKTLSFRARYEKDFGKPNATEYNIAIRGPFGLESGLRKTGNTYFNVRNGSYAFSIERSSDGQRTSLQFVEQLGIDPATDAMIEELEETPRALGLAAFSLWTDPLPPLIESGAFSIKRVYIIPEEDSELVHVEFEYLVDKPSRRIKYRITNGYLVCDPTQEWALTEYRGTRHNYINNFHFDQCIVLELGDSIDGLPIATKILLTNTFLNDSATHESVITGEITGHDLPEEELYLSFYGLSEPNFDRSWFGTWGWYLIGGIVCIAIGVIIKWRMARR